MKATNVCMSDMPGPKVYNLWWGDKSGIRQKGVIQYSVSPFRQRASKNLIQGYIFNGYRRLSAHFAYWAVPASLGYAIYAWAKSRDAWHTSKAGHI
ncbi:hypothetical protein HETIRDRAFT_37298, partial [Heterobasidion irregulare TC 32-1]